MRPHAIAFGGLLVVATCLLRAAAAGGGGNSDAFFERGTEVVPIKSKADWEQVEKSNFVWIVAFYRESCGYCALLRPEWEGAASQLKRYVKVGAVDVEKRRGLASAIQQRYGFQVEGVPTIKTFTPPTNKMHGKRSIRDYNGERKAKAVVGFMRNAMPNFVVNLSPKTYPQLRVGSPIALLLTDKGTTSSMAKALASKFRGRATFAKLRVGKGPLKGLAAELLPKLNAAWTSAAALGSFPVVVAMRLQGAEGEAEGGTPRAKEPKLLSVYKRKLSYMGLEMWLMDHAPQKKKKKAKAKGAGKAKGGAGKGAGKAKRRKGGTEAERARAKGKAKKAGQGKAKKQSRAHDDDDL